MPEIEDLLRELKGPDAPVTGLRIPSERPRHVRIAVTSVILLAAASLMFWGYRTPYVGQRGAGSGVDLDLRMIVSRDGQAFRVSPDATYHTGESVYFRVAASRPVEAWLWADGPAGREPIASIDATSEPRDVRQGGGLVAYLFETPGSYVFSLSTVDAVCDAETCKQLTLDVR